MRTTHILFALAIGLSGCAGGSGIVPLAPDTYVVSAFRVPALGGGPEAHRVVLVEAQAFCAQQGRQAQTLEMRPAGDPFTPFYPTAFDHIFRCSTRKG